MPGVGDQHVGADSLAWFGQDVFSLDQPASALHNTIAHMHIIHIEAHGGTVLATASNVVAPGLDFDRVNAGRNESGRCFNNELLRVDGGNFKRSILCQRLIVCIADGLLIDLFGFGFNAFQMAGGVIVFLVGMEMLHGRMSKMQSHGGPEDTIDADASVDIAVSPLAIPILAGPGTITTAMNFASGRDLLHTTATIAVFAVMCIITYVTFLSSEVISAKLGDSFMKVISRLMGLILVAIAMEMFIAGIKGAFLKA